MDSASPSMKFIDNPLAPEIFAGAAAGFLLMNGNVHITFTVPRPDHDPGHLGHPMNTVVVGRVVMPLAGAQGLVHGLYDFLKRRGFDPLTKPADARAVQ